MVRYNVKILMNVLHKRENYEKRQHSKAYRVHKLKFYRGDKDIVLKIQKIALLN